MPFCPLSQYGGIRCGLTARMADRAVLVELRRFLAVIHATAIPLCRRHHRTVHEGRVRADAPKRAAWADAPNGRVMTDAPAVSLPPILSAHSGALSMDESATLSNGAAIYRDSAIPWSVEAAAREAMEDS